MCFWPFSKKKKKKVERGKERWKELEAMVKMDDRRAVLAGALFQERMNRKLKTEDASSWAAEDELEYQTEELQKAIQMLEEDGQAKQTRIRSENKKTEEEPIDKKVYPKKTFVVELVEEKKQD